MYQRVLIKVSGEALSSESAVVCRETVLSTARRLKGRPRAGRADWRGRRRRQHPAREKRGGDGAQPRRPYGHARHGDQRPCAAGRARTARRAVRRAVRRGNGPLLRLVLLPRGKTRAGRGKDRRVRLRQRLPVSFQRIRRRRCARRRSARTRCCWQRMWTRSTPPTREDRPQRRCATRA